MVFLTTTLVRATGNEKAAAVAIALGVIALLWIFASVSGKSWNPWTLVEGADGAPSTSKLQWLVWLVVIIFAYVALWVVRAASGHYGAISTIPANLLAVLGFSTGSAIAAKGITSTQVSNKQVAKPTKSVSAAAPGGVPGGIFVDDSGAPEIAKIQMIGFTIVAVGIFLATVVHQLHTNPVQTSLPNIDPSLLVLMGISHGGYLGKKLVTAGTPGLLPLTTHTAQPGTIVTLKGVSLGGSRAGNELLLDGVSVDMETWSDTAIRFKVPATPPNGEPHWPPEHVAKLSVVVNGQASNQVGLRIGPGPKVHKVQH